MRRVLLFGLAAILISSAANIASAAIDYTSFVTQPSFNTGNIQIRLDNGDAGFTNGTQGWTYGNNTGGGEFRVLTFDSQTLTYEPLVLPGNEWIWKTFCIEKGEFFQPNAPYYVTIDDVAYYGTAIRPSSVSPEPLTAATKLLYGLYFEGRLATAMQNDAISGGVFAYQDDAWADSLQKAIWFFEEGQSQGSGTKLSDLINFASSSVNQSTIPLGGSVRVLNLWSGPTASGTPPFGNAQQSQLVYTPNPSNIPPVPEPGAIVIWGGLSISLLALARSRRLAKA
jgi:hypothetical protein